MCTGIKLLFLSCCHGSVPHWRISGGDRILRFKFSYYVTGFFILLGVTLGRFICGFLCPFGWFQDLLHKIPGKKFSTARLKPLRYLKYMILIVFVILLPLLVTNSIGMGDPFFCKYICPQAFWREHPAFPGKCSHTVRTWKTLYLEMLYFDHSCRVKHFILQTLL